jgi:lysophospholipase L1-like esterase
LYIGNSGTAPWLTQGELNGTMYRAIFWPTKLTSAQVKTASFAALQEANSRGIQQGPQIPWNIGTFLIHFIGDSITAGFGVTNPWPTLVGAINGLVATVKNWGVNSLSARQISLSEQDRVAPQCRSISGISPVAIVFAGTNDFIGPNPTQTGVKVWGALQSEISTLKVAGCKVFVATMLSRSGTGTNSVSNDVNKNALDLQIAGNWKEAGATGLIDFANNPLLGADGASANTSYFQVDAIHPNQTGANLLASIATSVLNYYYSPYSLGSPHVYTASATLTSADAGVATGTLSATTAFVMPDCSGLTGAPFLISNTQSAQTVTIAGAASQPINGLASAITIPANSTVRLTAVANPYTTSGCHWAM